MTLSDVMSSFRAAYEEWEGILVDPNYVRIGDRRVTWGNDSGEHPGSPLILSEVIRLAEAGQYTFRLSPDGSLLQMHYEWDERGRLLKAGLAYLARRPLVDEAEDFLPAPGGLEDVEQCNDDDEEGGEVDELDRERKQEQEEMLLGLDEDSVAPWVRFDFDPGAGKRGVLHHDTHLHLVGFPRTRVAVSGVPTPRQFIEFVISSFYPTEYVARRLDDDYAFRDPRVVENLNEKVHPTFGATPLHLVAHLALPGCVVPDRAARAPPREKKR